MTQARYLYSELAGIVDAYHRCVNEGNSHASLHAKRIRKLVREFMPSGSGIDNGCTLDVSVSHANKLVFNTRFRHRNDGGFDDWMFYINNWTDHVVYVKPSLIHKIDLRITGVNRNDVKELLHSAFYDALMIDISAYIEAEVQQARAERLAAEGKEINA